MESATKPRLREQVRTAMHLHHYSIRTEKFYWHWIRYFIRFHPLRYPLDLGVLVPFLNCIQATARQPPVCCL
ncbi:phage integrase N-terminal SAM-like domain-containing protein [Aeromonas sp. Marseille-Q5825]|uniref:phage integrase N-terminal SAM-like domain-containing protein n=1 Tax=Aeromonas TaxID=642 RepID=UPI0021C59797|nr:phage integrase N-terminal SAM-like domain-containing protein [Aeromonas sp. Marseille-Q5825]